MTLNEQKKEMSMKHNYNKLPIKEIVIGTLIGSVIGNFIGLVIIKLLS